MGRGAGMNIYAETCPQYLVLTAEDLKGLNMDISGAKYVCSPPPRDRASQQLSGGRSRAGCSKPSPPTIARFAMTTRPARRPEGADLVPLGAKRHSGGRGAPADLSRRVSQKGASAQEFVALTSTNHAKMYGLYPRKGSIVIRADADIVIWDANRKVTLTDELMQHGSDYTPYEGLEVTGWPVKTLLRGQVVVDDGRIVASQERPVPAARDDPAAACGRLELPAVRWNQGAEGVVIPAQAGIQSCISALK